MLNPKAMPDKPKKGDKIQPFKGFYTVVMAAETEKKLLQIL